MAVVFLCKLINTTHHHMKYLSTGFALLLFSLGLCAQTQRPAVFYGAAGSWADSVFNAMTLDEKIGQLFMVAAYSNMDERHEKSILNLIEKQHIGGLIFMQGGPYRQARLTNLYQQKAKTPLLIAMDAEWGLSMRLDSTFSFPWNLTLGAITNNEVIYDIGAELARQCRRLGVHVNFAPVVDINTNPNNPIINARSFGEDTRNVFAKSRALMMGMQSERVLACAKHFPGHGDTDKDSHLTLPAVNHDRARLDSVELFPFRKLVDYGLASIMSAHLRVPSLEPDTIPTSVSKAVLTDLLREEYGFGGLIFTDALNMKGITNLFPPGEADLQAFMAGNDVLLFAEDVPRAITMFKKALKDERITEAEINQRVRRILMAKEWAGLNDVKSVAITNLHRDLHSTNAKILNRKVYEQAVTLLKNVGKTVPIQYLDDKRVAVVTAGTDVNNALYREMKHYQPIDVFTLTASNANELLDKLAVYDKVVYALYTSNATPWKSYKYAEYIKTFAGNLGKQNNFVLAVFGNPYGLRHFPEASLAQSVIVAYQNDPDAASITAQILYGAKQPKGKLPVSSGELWPVNMGLSTRITDRLQYGMPEEVGLDSRMLARIDKEVESAISDHAIPGAQVLVARKGVVVFEKSYGFHTYDKKRPVDIFDVYDLASVTKIAASVPSLMYLTDLGRFHLDGTLGDHLPLVKGTNKEFLVMREILSHQSGLVSWIPFYVRTVLNGKGRLDVYNNERSFQYNRQVAENMFIINDYRDSILNEINRSNTKPTQGYKYSDLGYYYFQQIIESETRMRMDEFVTKHFYEPIGAHRMRFNPREHLSLDEIIPTENDLTFRGQLLHGYVHDKGAAMLGGVAGHAGVFSNANDLAKLMQMYLNGGSYGGHRYFDSLTVGEFSRCQFCDETNNRRGAGFDKPQLEGNGPTCGCLSMNSFGHSGFTGTLAWVDPDEDIVYIFLSNRVHPSSENTKLLSRSTRTNIQKIIYESIIN